MRGTRIIASSAIPRFGKDVGRASKRAVAAGARAGRDEARRHVPVGDGKSGVSAKPGSPLPPHARDSIETLPIGRMKRGGWRAAFGSADPTILWLDRGTLGAATRKRKTVKAEIRRKYLRQSKSGRSHGIRPLRFMEPANRVALARALVVLKLEASRKVRYIP